MESVRTYLDSLYKKKSPLLYVVPFGVGIVLAIIIYSFLVNKLPARMSDQLRIKTDSGKISPLLLCSDVKENYFNNKLTKTISSYVNSKIDGDQIKDISVYYRDLTNGSWTGVNEDDEYAPASLMKVPVMMAIYKKAESNPNILSKQVYYNGSFDLNASESIKPQKSIVAGRSYSVSELVMYMIDYSDNNAANLLLNMVTSAEFSQIFNDLSIPQPPQSGGMADYLSARLYARFFRVLYNATYLNQEYSLKAMDLLTIPDFPQGISAGLPSGVELANKFGERTILKPNGDGIDYRELHDCGIVYDSGKPYALCIMTKGSTDFATLENIIQTISKIVYTNR